MAEDRVLAFINENNRPYSVQLVSDMLAQFGLKKGPIQKALDSLAEANKINCKEFGKTKIYIPIQDPAQELSKEDMEELMQKKLKLQEEAKEAAEKVQSLTKELQGYNSTLTVEEIQQRAAAAREKVSQLNADHERLSSGAVLISPEDRDAAEQAFSTNVRMWQKRRTMFMSIWGDLRENLEGNQAELLEDMGVETDESQDVDLKQFQQMLPKKMRVR